MLEQIGLRPFVQTTGSRGLHVVAPIRRRSDFEPVRAFARAIADRLAERHPARVTVVQRIVKRGRRVYIDVLRNAYGQTAVTPYSVRVLPGAPVDTPLEWCELDPSDLDAQHYTVANVFRRLGQRDCPWRSLARHACDLERAGRWLA
jgi:bifunctional non-homologous end joining protein LigD